MRYEHITMYVRDLENALSFYRDLLGLGMLRRISAENMKIAFLGEAGQPSIELSAGGRRSTGQKRFFPGFPC